MTAPIKRQDFLDQALRFISDRIGEKASAIQPETDLRARGILDSLLIIEFFVFLEQIKGSPIDASTFSLDRISTLDAAYELVTSTHP